MITEIQINCSNILKHFLCNSKKYYPKLRMDLDESYLNKIEQICNSYFKFAADHVNLQSRKDYNAEKNKKKEELLLKMQHKANDRFLKYQKEVEEQKRLNNEKKRQTLDLLKEQMENDLKKREEEKLKIKQEDRNYMENIVNRNFEMSQKQDLLKEIVKKELINEYESLTKKAEDRESAAKLKIQELSKILSPNPKAIDSLNNLIVNETQIVLKTNEKNNDLGIIEADYTPEKFRKQLMKSNLPENNNFTDNSNPININDNKSIEHVSSNKSDSNNRLNIRPIDIEKSLEENNSTQLKKIYKDKNKYNVISDKTQIEPPVTNFNSKNVNQHGHSSISQIQDIIYNWNETSIDNIKNENQKIRKNEGYNTNHSKRKSNDVLLIDLENEINKDQVLRNERFSFFSQKDSRVDSIRFDDIIKPYEININFLFELPVNSGLMNFQSIKSVYFNINLVDEFIANSNFAYKNTSESSFCHNETDFISESEESNTLLNKGDSYSFNYIEIDDILNRILYKPIQIQSELVNKCLINHFLFDLNIEDHLEAIRRYFLFENGEFAQVLVDQLSDNIFSIDCIGNTNLNSESFSTKLQLRNLLNPIYVYEAFNKAMSQIKNCKYVDNLTIFIDNSSLKKNEPYYNDDILMCLNCIELKYTVEFPLNLVINQKNIQKYNKLFKFLLQIKFVMHSNKNIWYNLKKNGN